MRVYRHREKGFTLLELLLVLVIISLSLALVTHSVSSGLETMRVKTTAKKIALTLKLARTIALKERRNFYVDVDGDRLIIRDDDSAAARKEVRVPAKTRLSATDGFRIVFFPTGGSSGGELRVGGANNDLLFGIRVEPFTGRVNVVAL